MRTPEALGLAIRERRSEVGLSLEEASSLLGVGRARLARVEEGRADPTFDLLLSLADALDTTLSELFRRAEELSRGP